MEIKFNNLKEQYLEAKVDIDSAIASVIDSSSFITGEITNNLERTFAKFVGAEACAATGSGTMSLMCALMACDIQPGDEVITTPHTFISTSEAIIWQGAIPVYVDIDDDYLIDIDQIESKINNKTKAILFVDMYGQTPDIDRLKQIATKHNLYLIEDAAHSIGTEYKGQTVGGLVDLTCFSFNPVKNLGAMGDAGAITGKEHLINKARMYANHGRTIRWIFDNKGLNARIDNMQAAIVQAKLPYLAKWLDRKRNICQRYTQELQDYCVVPNERDYAKHTYYVYVIQVKHRDEFIEYMASHGVQCSVHYFKGLHQQPLFKDYASENYIKTTEATNNIVSLPCHWNITDKEQDFIIQLIKEWK
jgi:dTDP-4-amino-4,6-dideoxygalactose transaminase